MTASRTAEGLGEAIEDAIFGLQGDSLGEKEQNDWITKRAAADAAILAIEVEAAAPGLRAALEQAIERLTGSVHGMTVNKDKSVTAGMEDSDGSGLWQGEWVQKGVVIHAIRAALAATPVGEDA